MNCEFCARYGKQVPYEHIIEGTPMCLRCYRGAHPLDNTPLATGSNGRPRALDLDQLEEVKVAIKKGQTQRALAERYKCSSWVIHRIKREMLISGEMAPENRGKYAR